MWEEILRFINLYFYVFLMMNIIQQCYFAWTTKKYVPESIRRGYFAFGILVLSLLLIMSSVINIIMKDWNQVFWNLIPGIYGIRFAKNIWNQR